MSASGMRCGRWILLCVAALLTAVLMVVVTPAAQAAAVVRVRLDPAGEVMPGQPVKLVVDVLTDEFFTGAPVLPTLEVPGAIVTPPSDESQHINDTIDGKPWSGISRSYLITPQAGGELKIPALTLTAKVGAGGKAATLHTKALSIKVKVVERPAGAENAIGTSRLTITQSVDRSLTGLKQGDAFTRRVEIKVDGVQAMLLPETPFAPVAGLALYPKAPLVEDLKADRGVFLGGHRVDAATYVAQKVGNYSLPAISVQWWDTRANQLRVAQVPALQFSVAANPGYQPAIALPAEKTVVAPAHRKVNVMRVASIGAAVIVLVLGVWFCVPRLRRAVVGFGKWRVARRRRHEASEAHAFSRLVAASGSGNRASTMAALYDWLEREPLAGDPGLMAQAAAKSGEISLIEDVDRCLASVYARDVVAGNSKTDSMPISLFKGLRAGMKSQALRQQTALPSMNPR